MKYISILVLFLFPCLSFASVDQSIPYQIATITNQYSVMTTQSALFLTNKESGWVTDKVGDTHLICNAPKSPNFGKPQRSRGVWQISDCWHPEVTDAQAFDVIWATHWAMQTMTVDKGCKQWSTCKLLGLTVDS